MLRYIVRRVLESVPTLLLIVTLAFVLLHAAPGGPFAADKALLPEIQRSIEARYHLEEPLWRQYVRYLGDLLHGELRPAFQVRKPSRKPDNPGGFPGDGPGGPGRIPRGVVGGIP